MRRFVYSVRDDAVAKTINRSMGKRVSLIYQEHIGVPTTCFAETRNYISGVKVIEDAAPLAPPSPPPPAQTQQQ